MKTIRRGQMRRAGAVGLTAVALALSSCSAAPNVPGLSSAQEACASWYQMSERISQGFEGNPISSGEWVAFATKILAAAARADKENNGFGYLHAAATRLQVVGPDTGDLDGMIGMSEACTEFRKQEEAGTFAASSDSNEQGQSGYLLSDEVAYLAAVRSNLVLGGVARSSKDEDLLVLAVPICVGVRELGQTPKEVGDALLEVSVDPPFVEELVRIALQHLCPASVSGEGT
jgi:hypothetical protein